MVLPTWQKYVSWAWFMATPEMLVVQPRKKNLQFGIPDTFLLLLNSGLLPSYKMSHFGTRIQHADRIPKKFPIGFFSDYPFEMKNIQIPKLSDFGTSGKPPKLIFGNPPPKIHHKIFIFVKIFQRSHHNVKYS